jgi:hypothetical protein
MLCDLLVEQENLRVSDAAAGSFSPSRRELPYCRRSPTSAGYVVHGFERPSSSWSVSLDYLVKTNGFQYFAFPVILPFAKRSTPTTLLAK